MSGTLQKGLAVGIVLSTILWSMMASVLVAPLKASAAGCTSGSLIKGSLAAVYYCGSDGKRYVFTNDKAYFTWYSNFSGVMTISDADLASIQIGGNVTYRPGVKMLKIQSDPKTYAIAHGGVLRHVPSEACAVTLYGSAWNTMIDDVSDAFFTNYSVGAAINAACSDYDKTAEMSSSQSINQDKNLATTGVSGTATVSLASDSPAGATLPKGAMGVNFLKFNLTNNGASMTVDSVTLHRVGPGATTDISSVYLYEGATRLTTGRSVNSSTNEVTFTGLNLSLAAGQTRTLWVSVDIATGAASGNVHAMELSSAMSGTTMLSGSPFTGNNFTLAGTTVGSLTINRTGSITNPKAGEMEAKIGEFTIQAGSSEDVRLERLTLFQGGSLSGANLTNLKLKQAGLTIATAIGFDANLRATMTLSAPGMLLEKGATKTFQVYADIGGGARAGDNLKLYMEEDSDLRGIGQTFGQGVTVNRNAADTPAGSYDGADGADGNTTACASSADSTDNCSFSQVEAGPVTVAFKGPFPADGATYAKDAELLRFTMTVQNRTEVRRMQIKLTANTSGAGASGLINTSTPNYTDVKVVNTASGAAWWGPMDLSGTGDAGAADLNQTLTFTDVQTLEPGVVYEFAVTADPSTSITSGETVTATRLAFGSSDLRNLDNSTFLSPTADVVPSGDMTGYAQTMYAAALYLSQNALANSLTYIKGSTGVLFLGLTFASEFGTVTKLSSLKVTGFIDADGSSDYVQGQDVDGSGTVAVADVITSCSLIDAVTGEMRGQLKSPASGTDGSMTFSGLDWEIDAIGTTGLLYCDISNTAFKNSNAERVAFKVVADTNATVQDALGNTVSTYGVFPINNAPTSVITTANAGTMTYALAPDDTESEAGLVISNTTTVLGKLRLTAQNEELKQTKLRVSLVNAAQNNVISMSLYDGATLVAGPVPLTATNTDFSGFNFVVPKDGSKTLTVKGVLNTMSGGATSGADLQVSFDTGSDDGQSNFEYRGTSSSTVVASQAGADVTGRNKILRKTKPTVSLASLPTTTLTNGTMVLGRVTITADSAEQVSLKSLIWTIGRSDPTNTALTNGGGQSAVREVGQGSHIAGTAVVTQCAANATNTACTVQSIFSSEQTIAAGTSKTYELVLTVAGAASNDSLSTSIATDSAMVTGELAAVSGNAGDGIDDTDGTNATTASYNFQWSDNSGIPHNDVTGATADGEDAAASNDWTNGLYVKVLPTDTQTVLFP